MIKYAKGPVSFLYKDVKSQKTGKISRRKVKQLLWGDWVRVKGPEKPKWAKVKYGRGTYLMKLADLQDERALEIIFLDVGQGDGCILTEPGPHPDPKILIIDAGIGRNMRGFLDWRFRDFPETGNIHAAIITHPDKDHYNGFSSVFSNQKLKIEHVYHNGIVERKGADRLGPAKDGYLTDVIVDHNQAKALVTPKANRGRMPFPNLIKKAIDAAHIGEVKALTTAHAVIEGGKAWIPGFEPSAVSPISIEVLGPVVERDAIGKAVLRQLGQQER